jgi:hypothetical protein
MSILSLPAVGLPPSLSETLWDAADKFRAGIYAFDLV